MLVYRQSKSIRPLRAYNEEIIECIMYSNWGIKNKQTNKHVQKGLDHAECTKKLQQFPKESVKIIIQRHINIKIKAAIMNE